MPAQLFIPGNISAESLPTSDFSAGRIIEDATFYNKDSMNAQQIQAFLNTIVPTCDTNGTAPSGYGSLNHAQYAQQVKGWAAPPYVCLNNYYENPTTGETSFERGGGAFDGGMSAAQIIYAAAQQYGINPQVLLVMLKKESPGPLTADNWPLKSQYKYAMGYACPDSGPNNSANCDDSQAGFYKQIMKAAWQLNYYKLHYNDYRYKIGQNNIQYSTDVSCGTKSVNIENIATLSLYIYTPYTPNDAALANYPGTAPCGAYGNRNFFMYFKEWFGSPNYRPVACNSPSAGISCVWQLYNPTNLTDFLTIDSGERDASVYTNHYSYEKNLFYGFSSQRAGTIPVYRIKMTDRYFYTASETEKNAVLQGSGTTLEGVAFYVFPADATTNATYQVYRLNGIRGHVLTTSSTQRDALVSAGYTYEGVAFNAPSAFAQVAAPVAGRQIVYRITNGKNHLYTSSLTERDNALQSGWSLEGSLLQAPATATSTPVFRLFNGSDHLFTTSVNERDGLRQKGWQYEGIAWYDDTQTPPVYRFYTNGEHFYTADLNEALSITNKSANFEGIGFGNTSASSVSVYRLYNGHTHFFTSDIKEVLSIVSRGWAYEGVAWQAPTTGNQVYRLYANGEHFYTASAPEKDALVSRGWAYEGVAWQAPTTGNQVYRLYANGEHFYTASAPEKDALVSRGWAYEGVAW